MVRGLLSRPEGVSLAGGLLRVVTADRRVACLFGYIIIYKVITIKKHAQLTRSHVDRSFDGHFERVPILMHAPHCAIGLQQLILVVHVTIPRCQVDHARVVVFDGGGARDLHAPMVFLHRAALADAVHTQLKHAGLDAYRDQHEHHIAGTTLLVEHVQRSLTRRGHHRVEGRHMADRERPRTCTDVRQQVAPELPEVLRPCPPLPRA